MYAATKNIDFIKQSNMLNNIFFGDCTFQMYESEQNLFLWDDSAAEVTSPIVSVEVKTTSGQKLPLDSLSKPVTVNFPPLYGKHFLDMCKDTVILYYTKFTPDRK